MYKNENMGYFLAEDDKPKNKLDSAGLSSLSNAELIAIIIGAGASTEEAIKTSRALLQMVDYDLNALARLTKADIMKVPGIGQAKAKIIICALELAKRKSGQSVGKKPKITASSDAYAILRPYMQDLPHEEFYAIMLNRANQVLKVERISQGGISGTVADPKMIFKKALDTQASALVIAHNHPSGNTKPSHADTQLTKKLKQAGEVLEIALLDHIIYTDEGYFSFNDEGMM